MILYFADRAFNILGLAGDKIKRGYNIENDKSEISVENGIATLSFDIYYDDNSRSEVEQFTYTGNYILTYSNEDHESKCYTIIDTEQSTADQMINVYAEDVGLDLINDVVLPFNYETASYDNNVNHVETAPNDGWMIDSYGTYKQDSNFRATNLMLLPEILPEYYIFEGRKNVDERGVMCCAFYDSSKNYIPDSVHEYYIYDNSNSSMIPVPYNAKYVRVSFQKNFEEVWLMASSLRSYSIETYALTCIDNSGFEIGLNEFGDQTLIIQFDSSQTASERLHDIAEEFGAELSFSYAIDGLRITHKFLNIYKRRGSDNRVELRLGRDVKNIRVKRSVSELATAVIPIGKSVDNDGNQYEFTMTPDYTGNVNHALEGNSPYKGYTNSSGAFVADENYLCTDYVALPTSHAEYYSIRAMKPEGEARWYGEAFYDSNKNYIGGYQETRYVSIPISEYDVKVPENARYIRISFHKDFYDVRFAEKFSVDDEDYYIEGNAVCSRKAYAKWSRFLSSSGKRSGHITKQYEYECSSQKTLYDHAVEYLKTIEDASVEYEVDLYSLPDSGIHC